MLKFKNKEGKVVGVLKDNASEPEGDFMKFVEYTNEDELAQALPPVDEDEISLEDLEKEMTDAE